MFQTKRYFVLIVVFLTVSIACTGGEMAEKTAQLPSIEEIPAFSWNKLSKKKICFGHQSVGANIIEGIKELMQKNPQIHLEIVQRCGLGEASNLADSEDSGFFPFRVGKNMDPGSKIEDFARFMEKGVVKSPDIALFKFCYVDITAKTDVEEVFNRYKRTMSDMKKAFPKTTFVHVTVPLTSKPMGIKGWIKKAKDIVKKIIGRPVFNYYDNISRNKFNEMLREEYGSRAPVFDLAKIESTFPYGRRSTFTEDRSTYYSLVPDYTYDGGHLNELGRKRAAERLLIFLAHL